MWADIYGSLFPFLTKHCMEVLGTSNYADCFFVDFWEIGELISPND
jgi:hypothetical protein